MEFGKELKLKEFFLDTDCVCLNHGSYGAVPRRVLKEQVRLKELTERHPDDWYRRRNPRLYRECLELLAPLIGASVKDTVFVENASFGLHSCLFSLELAAEDSILTTNISYHAVKRLADARGCSVIQMTITFPIGSKDEILKLYRETLQREKTIKVAIIDHVTSPTAVVLPVKEIAELCRSHGVVTIVDGAHGFGQVPLNIESLGVDFYTGNIHKWVFTPRGAAFLWVSPQYHSVIRPGVVSHFHGNRLHLDFCVRGTRDDTSYYTLPVVLEFCQELGGMEKIRTYMRELLDEAVERLEKSWGTRRLAMAADMQAPGMRLVQVPDMRNYSKTPTGASDLESDLYNTFKIQVLCMAVEGELFIRISGHVYNCIEDYEHLDKALMALRNDPIREKKDQGYKLPIMHWDLSPLMFE